MFFKPATSPQCVQQLQWVDGKKIPTELLQKFSHQVSLCITVLHQQHSLWCLQDGMMLFFFWGVLATLAAWQDLRGISLIASEVTNANYYKVGRIDAEPLRVGLKRHIFATNHGAFVPCDPAQITCPLDLRLTEIQVAKTGGQGWSAFTTAVKYLTLQRILIQDPHPEIKWHHASKICTTWPLAGLCSKSDASRCLSQPP